MQTEIVSLATLGRGGAIELWDNEFRRVLQNVDDPNTNAEAVRSVTLKVTLRPNEHRDVLAATIECHSTLAGHKPHSTVVYLGREHRDGPLVAVQQNQRDMFPNADATPEGVTPLETRKEEAQG